MSHLYTSLAAVMIVGGIYLLLSGKLKPRPSLIWMTIGLVVCGIFFFISSNH